MCFGIEKVIMKKSFYFINFFVLGIDKLKIFDKLS